MHGGKYIVDLHHVDDRVSHGSARTPLEHYMHLILLIEAALYAYHSNQPHVRGLEVSK